MAEANLSQTEADALITMQKHRTDDRAYDFPDLGGVIIVPLISADRRESFLLDVSRGHIDLAKVKYQNRARQVVVLVRLDLAGAPHRNPDDSEIPCPHLHIYREGFGHRWAFAVPADKFPNMADPWETLGDFMKYCNITKQPDIRRSLLT